MPYPHSQSKICLWHGVTDNESYQKHSKHSNKAQQPNMGKLSVKAQVTYSWEKKGMGRGTEQGSGNDALTFSKIPITKVNYNE